MRGSWANSFAAGLAGLASACAPLPSPGEEERSRYAVLIDEAEPALAQVRLVLPSGASRLAPSRDGDGSGIGPLRCADGRALERSGASWSIPPGCGEVRWSVSLDPIDGAGIDASLPTAAFSRQGRFWLLPERDGLLRANAEGGSVSLRLQLADGRTVERRYIYPSNGQPPFYALIGPAPSTVYRRQGSDPR